MPYKNPDEQRAAQSAYYQKNRELYRERTAQSKRELYREIAALKEASPCTDCGNYYPFYVMQFDHVGDDKVLSVNHMLRKKGRPSVMAEIAKCELVCANCHAIRTWKRTTKARKLHED